MATAPTDLPPMQYRLLGRTGLKVSCLALGGWLTYGGHVNDESTLACLKAAFDAGINFFDCAEGYANGDSERIIGSCIRRLGWQRSDYVISTKINWGAANGRNSINNTGLSRKHIIEGTNASLQRLGLEYVDVIYAHRPDRLTPMEETVRAFNHVIETGKAFYWGTSEWDADEIERAHHVATRLGLIAPVVEQPQYNLLVRNRCEREYRLLCEEYGMGLTPFSPLKSGILTGKYSAGIPSDSRFATSSDAFAKSMAARFGTAAWEDEARKVEALRPIAEKIGTTLGGLAMAWVLRNGDVASAITGASRVEQVWEAIRSLEVLPKLTDEVMGEIDEVLGNRPEEMVRRFG